MTVSSNAFLPVATACINNCAYCGFRVRGNNRPHLLSPSEAQDLIERAARAGCTEALFTLGERSDSDPYVRNKLKEWGYNSMVAFLADLAGRALKYGLLPHTNAGVLVADDLGTLAKVNAGMGLMLETSSERLGCPGGPHDGCPGKAPSLRLAHIARAGRQGIPFTTGILVGIGETRLERQHALKAIADIHERYGHIQEVIVQPFAPHEGTPMEDVPSPSEEDVLDTLAMARLNLPPDVSIQIPPNLVSHDILIRAMAVADDLGGVSPVTPDFINPDRSWPTLNELGVVCDEAGFVLSHRLPVREQYITSAHLAPRVLALAQEVSCCG